MTGSVKSLCVCGVVEGRVEAAVSQPLRMLANSALPWRLDFRFLDFIRDSTVLGSSSSSPSPADDGGSTSLSSLRSRLWGGEISSVGDDVNDILRAAALDVDDTGNLGGSILERLLEEGPFAFKSDILGGAILLLPFEPPFSSCIFRISFCRFGFVDVVGDVPELSPSYALERFLLPFPRGAVVTGVSPLSHPGTEKSDICNVNSANCVAVHPAFN